MVRVRSGEDGTSVILCCELCKQPLRLAETWLVFRPGSDGAEGKWIHKACGDGRIEQLVGAPRAVLMRGTDALVAMAHLQGTRVPELQQLIGKLTVETELADDSLRHPEMLRR
jgi:hypothetical protein